MDGDEIDQGSNPADPTLIPIRLLSLARSTNTLRFSFRSVQNKKYALQTRDSFGVSWKTNGAALPALGTNVEQAIPIDPSVRARFYRVLTE